MVRAWPRTSGEVVMVHWCRLTIGVIGRHDRLTESWGDADSDLFTGFFHGSDAAGGAVMMTLSVVTAAILSGAIFSVGCSALADIATGAHRDGRLSVHTDVAALGIFAVAICLDLTMRP